MFAFPRAGNRLSEQQHFADIVARQGSASSAIRQHLDINNAKTKPFVWSKTADDTLASVEQFCLRTSNSRH